MDMGFHWLLTSRVLRSVGIIFVTLSSSLYLSLLGLSPPTIGLIFLGITAYVAGYSFGMGLLGDRVGYRKTLIAGEFISGVGILVLGLARNIDLIVPALIISGLGGTAGGARGAFSPGLTALVASNWTDEKERVRKMGLLTSASAFSGVGGSILLSIHDLLPFSPVEDYRILYITAGALVLGSGLTLLRVREVKRPKKRSKIMTGASFRYISRVIVTNSITGVGLGLAIPLLPLWYHLAYHVSSLQIGAAFTVANASTAIGSLVASRLKVNVLLAASLTRLLNGLFLVSMAFSPFFIVSASLYAVRGFNAGIGMPNRTAVNVRGVSSEDFGAASSLQGVATRLSQMSSGLGGYLLEDSIGLPLLLGGALQVLGGVLYYTMLKGRDSKIRGSGTTHHEEALSSP
jgi:MFS family permease